MATGRDGNRRNTDSGSMAPWSRVDRDMATSVVLIALRDGYVRVGLKARLYRFSGGERVVPAGSDEAYMVDLLLSLGWLGFGPSRRYNDGRYRGSAETIAVPRKTRERVEKEIGRGR